MKDELFMRKALEQAARAAEKGEIPVGAVIVKNGEILAATHNLCEELHDATAHAERLAISEAGERTGSWRLSDCTLYVTLEPCPMCAGAIIQARIENVYFGAYDPKSGCLGSVCDLSGVLPHKIEYRGGVMQGECEEILKNFFKNLRKRDK